MIDGFHAHVYFSAPQKAKAQDLCASIAEQFEVKIGRFHDQPVGPHPIGSCQITLSNDQFGDVIPWLSLHRDDLTIFVHPITGDDYADHSAHAIWLGAQYPLKLDIFKN